jgi:hypothetical protein
MRRGNPEQCWRSFNLTAAGHFAMCLTYEIPYAQRLLSKANTPGIAHLLQPRSHRAKHLLTVLTYTNPYEIIAAR